MTRDDDSKMKRGKSGRGMMEERKCDKNTSSSAGHKYGNASLVYKSIM